ncbi:hypothetical protein LC609_21855 [Nostoc sp. XA013]|nr:hypothetical protein [Nostoc sp. XA013]
MKSEEDEIKIFQDDYEEVVKTSLPSRFQLVRSLLYLFTVDSDSTKLAWFTKRMQRFIIVQIIPSLMLDGSEKEEIHLTSRMENFVSWYRYISQDQGKVAELINVLQDVLNGFISFKFEQFSKNYRTLKLRFSADEDRKKLLIIALVNYPMDKR